MTGSRTPSPQTSPLSLTRKRGKGGRVAAGHRVGGRVARGTSKPACTPLGPCLTPACPAQAVWPLREPRWHTAMRGRQEPRARPAPGPAPAPGAALALISTPPAVESLLGPRPSLSRDSCRLPTGSAGSWPGGVFACVTSLPPEPRDTQGPAVSRCWRGRCSRAPPSSVQTRAPCPWPRRRQATLGQQTQLPFCVRFCCGHGDAGAGGLGVGQSGHRATSTTPPMTAETHA